MKNREAGYTLVELIVVLMLMSILIGVIVWNTYTWQDHSDYTKVNETSKTIFMSAQHNLTQMKTRGILCEFIKGQESISSDTYIAVANTGDYDRYAKGADTSSKTAEYVFELIKDYINDRDVLNASIVALYTGNGKMVSVYFSEKTQLNTSTIEMDENDRYENCIGFYGE